MIHQNNKHLLQLALFTLFSSLLFVGTMYVSSVQAEDLTGTAKGTEFCEDQNAVDPGVADKGKFKEVFDIFVDFGAFPDIDGIVQSATTGIIPIAGTALSKNAKRGFFSWLGFGSGQALTLSGIYKTNKNTGEVVLLKGKFEIIDVNSDCIVRGKFKAKTDPNPPPPPMP